MIPLSLGAIAQLTGAQLVGAASGQEADPAALVTGPVIIDSRAAAPGALFAALPGPGWTGTSSPRRPWPPGRPRYWPPGRAGRPR